MGLQFSAAQKSHDDLPCNLSPNDLALRSQRNKPPTSRAEELPMTTPRPETHPWKSGYADRLKSRAGEQAVGSIEYAIEKGDDYRRGEMEIRARFDSNGIGGRFNG